LFFIQVARSRMLIGMLRFIKTKVIFRSKTE